ncbi:hypothetical protein MHYP_G00050740 [Metynnis hypsauchen]
MKVKVTLPPVRHTEDQYVPYKRKTNVPEPVNVYHWTSRLEPRTSNSSWLYEREEANKRQENIWRVFERRGLKD